MRPRTSVSRNGIGEFKKELYNKNSNGYVLLISVLVIGAVGIAVSTSLILLGLGASRTSSSLEAAQKAKALANSCAEEGLKEIQNNTSYTGNGTVVDGANSCSFVVTDTGGQTRLVVATATVRSVTRRVNVVVSAVTPRVSVASWQEVAN